MRRETKFQFKSHRWGINWRIYRIYWKGKEIQNKIDVIFLLSLSFGNMVNCFAKGASFYFALLEFGVKEDWRARFGFSLPIIRRNAKI